jgi:hypothetical protein
MATRACLETWLAGNIPFSFINPNRKGVAMTQEPNSQDLSESRRQEIFLALVHSQDEGTDVAASRTLMAQRFGVSEAQVRQIEREGLEKQWPPLEQ